MQILVLFWLLARMYLRAVNHQHDNTDDHHHDKHQHFDIDFNDWCMSKGFV